MANQPCPRCTSEINLAFTRVCGFCGWVNPTRRGQHSFIASAPKTSHWLPASCEDVDCWRYINGFRIPLDADNARPIRGGVSTQSTAEWLRAEKAAGRLRFTEQRTGEGVIDFVFPAGHPCFESHSLPIGASEIPPDLLHVTAGSRYRHERSADWREDMSETMYAAQKELA